MTDRDALEFLFLLLHGNRRGFLAVEFADGPPVWFDSWRRFRSVRHALWEAEPTIHAAAYLDRGSFRLKAPRAVVWARVGSGEQASRLEAFDPEPTAVIREGGTVRRVAFWALRRPLDPDAAEKVNRHLAHKLGTVKQCAEQLRFSPPGAVLRAGRGRALPIVLEGGSGLDYRVKRVCMSLPRSIPDPESWKTTRRDAA